MLSKNKACTASDKALLWPTDRVARVQFCSWVRWSRIRKFSAVLNAARNPAIDNPTAFRIKNRLCKYREATCEQSMLLRDHASGGAPKAPTTPTTPRRRKLGPLRTQGVGGRGEEDKGKRMSPSAMEVWEGLGHDYCPCMEVVATHRARTYSAL